MKIPKNISLLVLSIAFLIVTVLQSIQIGLLKRDIEAQKEFFESFKNSELIIFEPTYFENSNDIFYNYSTRYTIREKVLQLDSKLYQLEKYLGIVHVPELEHTTPAHYEKKNKESVR